MARSVLDSNIIRVMLLRKTSSVTHVWETFKYYSVELTHLCHSAEVENDDDGLRESDDHTQNQ